MLRSFVLAPLLTAILAVAAPASAQEASGKMVPAWTGPVRIEIPAWPGEPRITEHTFSFGRTLDYCGPKGEVKEVRLVERPVTKRIPFPSALITVIVEFPAYEQPAICPPMLPTWQSLRVRTKRPAPSLRFFDGSQNPPSQVWPTTRPR